MTIHDLGPLVYRNLVSSGGVKGIIKLADGLEIRTRHANGNLMSSIKLMAGDKTVAVMLPYGVTRLYSAGERTSTMRSILTSVGGIAIRSDWSMDINGVNGDLIRLPFYEGVCIPTGANSGYFRYCDLEWRKAAFELKGKGARIISSLGDL